MLHSILLWLQSVVSTPGGAAFLATVLRDAAEILDSEADALDGETTTTTVTPSTSGPASTIPASTFQIRR